MPDLKKRVINQMGRIALITTVFIFVTTVIYQIYLKKESARTNARETFSQIEQILKNNREELDEARDELDKSILRQADYVAYIMSMSPRDNWRADNLDEVADIADVDEIHIFDDTGEIISGTIPKYYGYTFDSGEQISFFKPMLTDKHLRLVQDTVPNTAEDKHMKYAAIWSKDKEYIIQVGLEEENVDIKIAAEMSRLPYIISLLRLNTGVRIYSAERITGKITGAISEEVIGQTLEDIGIDLDAALKQKDGFLAVVNGTSSFCLAKVINGNLVCYVIPQALLFSDIPTSSLIMLIALAVIAFILVYSVSEYIEKFVILGLVQTNEILRDITGGNLEKTVDVRTSLEFSELSDHINGMVESLLASTRKMSDILNIADVNIGVYEYHSKMDHVRVTDHVPDILALDEHSRDENILSKDFFQNHISRIKEHPLEDENGVYCLKTRDLVRYVRIEEIREKHETTGIVMDMTEEIIKMKAIKTERDIDQLTGILNRRGLDMTMDKLFGNPKYIEHCAVIMIDADDLKNINDTYGHDNGDIYIKELAGLLDRFGREHFDNYVVSRNGGDEFVMFLYNYDNDDDLLKDIRSLSRIQDKITVTLNNQKTVPLCYSMGYSIRQDGDDYYRDLFKYADYHMYENKRWRKKHIRRNYT